MLLYEVGTHLLDVSRFLFGEPESVYARLHHISPDVIGEDVQMLTLAYPGMTLVIHDSWASVPVPGADKPKDERRWFPRIIEVDGILGTLILRIDGSIHLYTDEDHKTWQCTPDSIPRSHIAAQQHFIDCLESGQEFETSDEGTIKTMALVYACYRSAEDDRVVDPKEMLSE